MPDKRRSGKQSESKATKAKGKAIAPLLDAENAATLSASGPLGSGV